jgi:hypothetical protein
MDILSEIVTAINKKGDDYCKLLNKCRQYEKAEQKSRSSKEENITLLELVDGAYDVIELYDAKTPAQKKWKNDWLEKARKFVDCE